MKTPSLDYRLKALLLISGLVLPCLQPSEVSAAGYGSLAGIVSDNRGVPLMGATVLVVGPTAFGTDASTPTADRMLTDARGRFTIAHLLPGWYSLKVSSPTRLPAMRNGVHVEAGETAVATFVLTDVFAPIRFQVPSNTVSSWGDDWKWVLRTSSSTRPILRYQQQSRSREVASRQEKPPLPQSHRIIGMLPGTTLHDPLSEDFGMTSVFTDVKPLSPDSDVLAGGSISGSGTTSLETSLRRNHLQDDQQEFGIALHQFSLLPGQNGLTAADSNGFGQARGLVATYSETRLLSPKLTVTTGMDISYLSAIDHVFTARPRIEMEYQASAHTVVSVQYGMNRETSSSLQDRLSLLNAFPQITQRDGHLEMERLDHTEVAVNHRLGKSTRVQVAAYHDAMHNAAVWGWGQSANDQAFAGNALPNPAGNGVVINGGNFSSNGFHAVFARTFNSRVEVLGAFASGEALSARGFTSQQTFTQQVLTPEQTSVLLGKITAELPVTRTRVSTSYAWVPNDRVTMVDPAMQGNLQTQPYLGLQVRQPIPTPNSWPVRIDAVAEFQNLLSQGYVPAGQGNRKPVVLSSGYHYVRGGFAVQF